MSELTHLQAARLLGMKEREVTAVEPSGGGWVVTTHDGQRTRVTADGAIPSAPTPPTAEPAIPPVEAEYVISPEMVPFGTERDVLGWVGDDRQKAGVALKVERAKEKPRKGVVDKLEQILAD